MEKNRIEKLCKREAIEREKENQSNAHKPENPKLNAIISLYKR